MKVEGLMELKDYLQIAAVIISALAIFRQMQNTNKQIKNQNEQKKLDYEYKRKEKAISMAIVFQEMLLEITYIVHVLSKSPIKENYYDKLKFIDLKDFDYNELVDKFGTDDLYEIEKQYKLYQYQFDELAKAYINYNFADDTFLKLYREGTAEDLERLNTMLTTDFIDRKLNVLNRLEWFSMNFTSGLADEEVVYQSLHQVYLNSIKLFHFEISIRNKNGAKDKYYCNIIELYNDWAGHYHEALETEKALEKMAMRTQEEYRKRESRNIRKTKKFKEID